MRHEHQWRRGRCECGEECDHPEPLDLEWREVRGRRVPRWRCRQCGTLDLTSERQLPIPGKWWLGPDAPSPGGDHVESAAQPVLDGEGRFLVEGPEGEQIGVSPEIVVMNDATRGARAREIADAVREGSIGQWWSEEWRRRRQLGVERRAERVAGEMAKTAPDLPDWLRLLPPEAGVTEKQREVLDLVHGHGLTIREAGRHIGISHTAVRKRLAFARRRVEAWYGTWDPEEFRDEQITNPDPIDPDWIADYLVPLVQRQRRWERAVERLYA